MKQVMKQLNTTSAAIASFLGIPLNGTDFPIYYVSSLNEFKKNSLCFFTEKSIDNFSDSNYYDSIFYILPLNSKLKLNKKNCYFFDNPVLTYINIIKYLKRDNSNSSIHPTAIIDSAAIIHPSVTIGAYSIIGKCEIGEGTIIKEHVHIHDNTYIGKDVVIYSSCEIGTEDLGVVNLGTNEVYLLPQLGSLIIEDDVEIFPFTAIGRGAMDNTIICKGVKIDHCCQIGHNTYIGKNTVITANSVVLGSTKIGSNCWIGSCSVIKEHLTIGNNVTVGIGAVVTKSIANDMTVVGNPAIELSKSIYERKKLQQLLL